MNFETKRITLTADAAPIDLAADSDIGLAADSGEFGQAWIVVQNVSTRTVRYAETTAAPAGDATDVGHTLAPGAGVELLLTADAPFWFWSTTGATIAVSKGAPSRPRP